MPTDGRQDEGYRLLFSQPRMVRDLCRGFLREEWIEWLDLETAERREGPAGEPLIWRMRWQGGSTWVYLLLEPRAEEDPAMALRMGYHREVLYQNLLRHRETAPPARLPVALPVVLYHGAARWTAPREALELLLPIPASLQRHAPRTRYLLLDAAHDPLPGTSGRDSGADNLISLLCRLERSRTPEAVDALLERLVPLLAGPGDETLRQAWSAFLGRSFLPRRFPHLFSPALLEAGDAGGVLA